MLATISVASCSDDVVRFIPRVERIAPPPPSAELLTPPPPVDTSGETWQDLAVAAGAAARLRARQLREWRQYYCDHVVMGKGCPVEPPSGDGTDLPNPTQTGPPPLS